MSLKAQNRVSMTRSCQVGFGSADHSTLQTSQCWGDGRLSMQGPVVRMQVAVRLDNRTNNYNNILYFAKNGKILVPFKSRCVSRYSCNGNRNYVNIQLMKPKFKL